MIYILTVLALIFAGCTPGYTSSNDTKTSSIDSVNTTSTSTIIKETYPPLQTEPIGLDLSDPYKVKDLFFTEFEKAIHGKGYDPSRWVLHKYYQNLEFTISNTSQYIIQNENYINRYSKNDWQKINFLHALPDRWYNMSYIDFLEERRKAMAKVIKEGFRRI